MNKSLLLSGTRFGFLTVVKIVSKPDYRKTIRPYYLCKCDCGGETILTSSALVTKHTISCGCKQGGSKLPLGKAAENKAWYTFTRTAKSRKHEVDITREKWLRLSLDNCFYCGQSPSNEVCSLFRVDYQKELKRCSTGSFKYNGIDRIDNSIGYVDENCVTSCKICNFAKRAMSQSDFIKYMERVSTFYQIKEHINIDYCCI